MYTTNVSLNRATDGSDTSRHCHAGTSMSHRPFRFPLLGTMRHLQRTEEKTDMSNRRWSMNQSRSFANGFSQRKLSLRFACARLGAGLPT
jgi:hypothetical protein